MRIRVVLPGMLGTIVSQGDGKEKEEKKGRGSMDHHARECTTAASFTGSEYIGTTIEWTEMCKSEFMATENFPGLNVTSMDQPAVYVHSAFSQSINGQKKIHAWISLSVAFPGLRLRSLHHQPRFCFSLESIFFDPAGWSISLCFTGF